MKYLNYLFLLLGTFVVMTSFGVNAQTNDSRADGNNGGYGQVYRSYGLTQATQAIQQNTQTQIQRAIMRQAAQNSSGRIQPASANNSKKSLAFFTPAATGDNFKIIADTVGQDAEQRNLFRQLFADARRGFDAELAPQGRKNSLAAALTFFIATTVTVYNDAPEPTEAAQEDLFQALTAMYDETPGMAGVPNKDKEFLYDSYVSFATMPLAFYTQAKQSNDAQTLKLAKVIAGALLLEILKINPNDVRFEGNTLQFKNAQTAVQTTQNAAPQQPARNYGITKYTTTFDDGWASTPTEDYVSVRRGGTEVRLYYDDPQLEATKRNTDGHSAFYWDRYILPFFNVGNVQKGDEVFGGFAVNELLMADAVHKQTGQRCYVGLWFLSPHSGGSKVFVVVAQSRAELQQLFPKAENIYPMLNSNRFAVTAEDMVGTWAGSGGGGVEYYSAYTGNYAGMNALSTSDNFVFSANGSYQQTHLSAQVATGGSQFARIDYKGRYSATDWEVTATNHYGGRPAKFQAQFIAVRGGYLLALTDRRSNIRYMLFKQR